MDHVTTKRWVILLLAIGIVWALGMPVGAGLQRNTGTRNGTPVDSPLSESLLSAGGPVSALTILSGTEGMGNPVIGYPYELTTPLINDRPQAISTMNDGNGPMDLTLTIAKIPVVNEETTITCIVTSNLDSPGTEINIDLLEGMQFVGGTSGGTWDIKKDTPVSFSAVVKFTKPGDYRVYARASSPPQKDYTLGGLDALYLSIGTETSGYTPPFHSSSRQLWKMEFPRIFLRYPWRI